MADGNRDVGGGRSAGRGVGAEELRYMSQVYQGQYDTIVREINAKIAQVKELNGAQQALERMEVIGGSKALTPVGYDVYLDSSVARSDRVVVGVGAGYLVEKGVDEAKQYVAMAVEKETKAISNMTRAKKEVEAALIEIMYKLEEAEHA
jgi:prefoldin alpha subunit